MAHWIIEDHGFGGQNYECSNCGEVYSDLFSNPSNWYVCHNCGEFINEDENEYIEINKRNKSDDNNIMDRATAMVHAAKKADFSKLWLLDVLAEDGLIGVYNLGLEHMYEYLKGE